MPELFVASVTPFTGGAGTVDHPWIARHLRWIEANGADGVVPCGTTGEGPSLSLTERMAVIDTVMEHRGGLKMYPGTGCAALSDTIAATRYAITAGADAALVLPPFFFKGLSDDGLLAYYRAVCEALPAGGRIVLYHIPPISQVAIPPAVIAGLLESHPEAILGLKDSGGDPQYTATLARQFPQLKIYTGGAPHLARALHDGAAGGIFALANAFPRELRALMDAFAAGADIVSAQSYVTALSEVLKPYGNVPTLKAMLPRLADLPPTSARLPLLDLPADVAEAQWLRVSTVLDPR